MGLQSLLKENKIETIAATLDGVKHKLAKAGAYLNHVKKSLAYSGENEPLYTAVYDALRIGCEAVLLFYGYRVKASAEARHRAVIEAAAELAGPALDNEFQRMQKMRKKRNILEYGDLVAISDDELRQAIKDAEKLVDFCNRLMKSKRPTLGI